MQVSEDCYAMVDSGIKAILVPLHQMCAGKKPNARFLARVVVFTAKSQCSEDPHLKNGLPYLTKSSSGKPCRTSLRT